MHAVGSAVIERARRPLVVVGPNVSTESGQPLGRDVVVGIDGVAESQPLLTVAATAARALRCPLRIVTVYEPVPPDMRRPDHYTRHHGPAGDPDAYLAFMRERVDDVGLAGVDMVAIGDPVGVAPGLVQHLRDHPARLLVVGGAARPRPLADIARRLVPELTIPLLLVNRRG
jgi:nucleotide-binding universal stress UspA family protein